MQKYSKIINSLSMFSMCRTILGTKITPFQPSLQQSSTHFSKYFSIFDILTLPLPVCDTAFFDNCALGRKDYSLHLALVALGIHIINESSIYINVCYIHTKYVSIQNINIKKAGILSYIFGFPKTRTYWYLIHYLSFDF